MKPNEISKTVSCTCGCHLLSFEKWTDCEDAFLSVYESSFYSRQRSRIAAYLKRLWAAIRGKEYLLFEIVLSGEDLVELKNTLIKACENTEE